MFLSITELVLECLLFIDFLISYLRASLAFLPWPPEKEYALSKLDLVPMNSSLYLASSDIWFCILNFYNFDKLLEMLSALS